MILPATNAPWVNLASTYIVDLMEISKPFSRHSVYSPQSVRKKNS